MDRREICVMILTSVLVSLCSAFGIKQGKVTEFYLDSKFDLSATSTLPLRVSSEVQCVQKCLQQNGCQLMNFKYVWDGDVRYNCEIYKEVLYSGKSLEMHLARGWKAARIERIVKKIVEAPLLDSRNNNMEDPVGINTQSMKTTPATSTIRVTTPRRTTIAHESLAAVTTLPLQVRATPEIQSKSADANSTSLLSQTALTISPAFTISSSLGSKVFKSDAKALFVDRIDGDSMKSASNPEALTAITTIKEVVSPDAKLVDASITYTDTVMISSTSLKFGSCSSFVEIANVASNDLSLTTTTTATSPLGTEIREVASNPVSKTTTTASSLGEVNINAMATITNTEVIPSTSLEITNLSPSTTSPDSSMVPSSTQTATTPLGANTVDTTIIHPEVTSPPITSITDDVTPSTSTGVLASSTIPAGVYQSCSQLYLHHPNAKNGVYDLTIGKHQCMMLDEHSSCGSGGWTMAMKIDGNKSTFSAESNYWTNTILYQNDSVADASMEGKYKAFNSLSFIEICIGFKYLGSINWLQIPAGGSSLRQVFLNGHYITSYWSKSSWSFLMQGASLQPNCHKQGLNVHLDSNMIARIGIVCDNAHEYSSPNSFIGLGTTWNMPWYCGDAPKVSCGNVASCFSTSNGQKAEAAFCYILIK